MINRAGNKEKAKRVLNENGNLSGMVGMEILYRVIAAITSVLLGAMIAGGIGVVSGGCGRHRSSCLVWRESSLPMC